MLLQSSRLEFFRTYKMSDILRKAIWLRHIPSKIKIPIQNLVLLEIYTVFIMIYISLFKAFKHV